MAVYASPQASPYRGRVLTCVVLMLDDTEQMFQVPVSHLFSASYLSVELWFIGIIKYLSSIYLQPYWWGRQGQGKEHRLYLGEDFFSYAEIEICERKYLQGQGQILGEPPLSKKPQLTSEFQTSSAYWCPVVHWQLTVHGIHSVHYVCAQKDNWFFMSFVYMILAVDHMPLGPVPELLALLRPCIKQ